MEHTDTFDTYAFLHYIGVLLYSGGSAKPSLDPQAGDGLSAPWLVLRDTLLTLGVDLVAIDELGSQRFDFLLHVNAHPTEYDVSVFAILAECGLVHPPNIDRRLLRQYRRVFTWMPDLVEAGLAIKIPLAHTLGEGVMDGYGGCPQLLVMISANKALPVLNPSHYLYRERVRATRWFEQHAPDDFALYGQGWDFSPRLQTRLGGIIHRLERHLPWLPRWFRSWRGSIPSKRPVLERARFSLVYENVRGLRGYITEKIFDAFCAGNVPVYWDAEDIEKYIPPDCFIDRRRFGTYDELYDYLRTMPEERFLGYQQAICSFLASDAAKEFSVQRFAQTVSEGVLSTLRQTKT